MDLLDKKDIYLLIMIIKLLVKIKFTKSNLLRKRMLSINQLDNYFSSQ